MDNMFVLMDVFIIGYGLYMIYAYVLMKTKGEIKANMLLSAEVKMEKCNDKDGYIHYMSPKLLIFGASTVVCGSLGLLNDYMDLLGSGYIVITVIFLILIIWFIWTVKKGIKMFW